MGYFSEMDFMQCEEMGWSEPTNVQQLKDRIQSLHDSLADLKDRCPRDVREPEFDRMFYSECLNVTEGDANTIQGLLQDIRKTEEQLRIAEEEKRRETEEQQRQTEWRNTVLETGATPDYQIVLMSVFFPAAGNSAAA